ncbi:MAG: hypothetical protein ACLFTQ_00250 [Candidatus Aenigmatarchaeota archaeon]
MDEETNHIDVECYEEWGEAEFGEGAEGNEIKGEEEILKIIEACQEACEKLGEKYDFEESHGPEKEVASAVGFIPVDKGEEGRASAMATGAYISQEERRGREPREGVSEVLEECLQAWSLEPDWTDAREKLIEFTRSETGRKLAPLRKNLGKILTTSREERSQLGEISILVASHLYEEGKTGEILDGLVHLKGDLKSLEEEFYEEMPGGFDIPLEEYDKQGMIRGKIKEGYRKGSMGIRGNSKFWNKEIYMLEDTVEELPRKEASKMSGLLYDRYD